MTADNGMDETEAKRIVSVWEKSHTLPTFRDIQVWSGNRKKDPGTLADAAKKFKLPARVIWAIMVAFGPYDYFYLVGDGPDSKEMYFEHDGE